MSHRIGTTLISAGSIVISGATTPAKLLDGALDHLAAINPTNSRAQVADGRELLAAFGRGTADADAVSAEGSRAIEQINYAVGQKRIPLSFVEIEPGEWGYASDEDAEETV